MKDTLLDLIDIVEALAIKIDGKEIAKLNHAIYPPRIEFEHIRTYDVCDSLRNIRNDLLTPPTRGERIDNLNAEFQAEKIKLLEEKVKLLEELLEKRTNIGEIQ